jgi:hypothetical protein
MLSIPTCGSGIAACPSPIKMQKPRFTQFENSTFDIDVHVQAESSNNHLPPIYALN